MLLSIIVFAYNKAATIHQKIDKLKVVIGNNFSIKKQGPFIYNQYLQQ